jgi:pyochelin biosynthetic protein PchC
VRYPGRQDRFVEPCVEQMGELADEITNSLLPLLDRPVALFGHSMGAAVAYEVAVRLEAQHGFTPTRLFVSGRQAPHLAANEESEGLSDDEFVSRIRALGHPDVGALDLPELRELFLPALRADFRLLGAYQPDEPAKLAAPITAYVGLSDPGCPVEGARAWSEVARGGFDLRVFPGDHFYLVPEQAALTADVAARLG